MAGWTNQKQQYAIDYLREENRVLREQLGTRRPRFTDDQRRRLAAKAKLVGRRLLNDIAELVTPDTLLAWHRKLIAQKYDGSAKRGPGRPRIINEIENLVVRMAQENRAWGYRRILGAISNLGYNLARGTVANILKKHGIEPAPERIRKTTWKEFLTRHWELIVATDFFTVVLANPDQIDKLGVVTHGSIPFWALIHGCHRLTFRHLSEPCGASAGDSRSAPPDRHPSALREAPEVDKSGSTAVGVAVHRLAGLEARGVHYESLHCFGLAAKRLSPFLDVEDSAWEGGAASGAKGSAPVDSDNEPRKSDLGCSADLRRTAQTRHRDRRNQRK